MLADQIVKHLSATVFPQSVDELVQAIPGVAPLAVEQACYSLREQHKLGRNGADTPESPFRYYMKRVTSL